MTLLVLYILALLDGLLCGARVSMGRSAVIANRRYYVRAQLHGPAERMLWVFVPYTALVLGNILLRLVPSTDIRSATSVMMLGPLTAIRPLVMVAGVIKWNLARRSVADTAARIVCTGADAGTGICPGSPGLAQTITRTGPLS